MTIFYIISRIDQTGPNKVLLNMIRGLEDKEVSIKIITFFDSVKGPVLEELKSKNIPLYCLSFKNKISVLTTGIKKVKKILEKEEVSVIHSHGILPDYINSKLFLKQKKITTIHNCMLEDYQNTFGKWKGYFFFRWHLQILKKMDTTVCCSYASFNHLKKYKKNCCCIQNGIQTKKISSFSNFSREEFRKKFQIEKEDIVYIFLGQLSNLKRIIPLLDRMQKSMNPKEHFFVLGDGPLKEECLSYENSNIHILGFQLEIDSYLKASDIYISFSSSEGFSISILEALENNLYLLLSNISSHNEIFEVNKKIYLGEIFDENNFEQQKQLLLKKMSKQATNEISKFKNEYFSDKAMMKKYWKYYQ